MPVGVRVRQDDDAPVAQACELEVLAQAAAERRHQVRQLLVLEHLRERCALGVEHLPAQRQDCLAAAIAPLLGRPAGRIAFDDEQLAVGEPGRRAVAELAGQREPSGRRGLSRHFLLRRAARFPRPCRQDHARDDRLGDAGVRVHPVLERRTKLRVDRRHHLRVVQPILRLSLKLWLGDEDAQHARRALRECPRR